MTDAENLRIKSPVQGGYCMARKLASGARSAPSRPSGLNFPSSKLKRIKIQLNPFSKSTPLIASERWKRISKNSLSYEVRLAISILPLLYRKVKIHQILVVVTREGSIHRARVKKGDTRPNAKGSVDFQCCLTGKLSVSFSTATPPV